MTVYGYLRVSTDDQDIENQRLGVDGFAREHELKIEEYITDEGVSGGKDPSKRNLGPLLKKIKSGDVVICSEISRLGRDLYMIMDILHHAMDVGCVIYTVKDRFTLGNDIQSKVLAFAFGLSAEIERQMIRQRTQEGLRRRVLSGVLLGRPIGARTTVPSPALKKFEEREEEIRKAMSMGAKPRRIAEYLGIGRTTLNSIMANKGLAEKWNLKGAKPRKTVNYKDEPYEVVELPRERVIELIMSDMTIPEIHARLDGFSYQGVYDTILLDGELNRLYRKHGQQTALKQNRKAMKND